MTPDEIAAALAASESRAQDPNRITRRQAFERGMSLYYTAVPCKHGHLAPRYVKSGGCVVCAKAASLAQYSKQKSEQG